MDMNDVISGIHWVWKEIRPERKICLILIISINLNK